MWFFYHFFVSAQVMPWPRADQDCSTRKRIQNENPLKSQVSFFLFVLYFPLLLSQVNFLLFVLYFPLCCLKWVWQWHELYPKWSLVLSASLTLSGEGESVIWQQLWNSLYSIPKSEIFIRVLWAQPKNYYSVYIVYAQMNILWTMCFWLIVFIGIPARDQNNKIGWLLNLLLSQMSPAKLPLVSHIFR